MEQNKTEKNKKPRRGSAVADKARHASVQSSSMGHDLKLFKILTGEYAAIKDPIYTANQKARMANLG